MSAVFDSFRRRMSFSPSPSSSRTPTPVKRAGSTTSRLSKEEIDEILDSPYETKYTYSDSAAYKPHIGSRDYVHPRLCRRLTSQSTSPLLAPGTSGTLPPNGAGWQWHNWQREKWTWAQLLIYIAQFFTIFTYTAVQYSLNRVYYATRYIFTSAVWYVVKYFVLWPILAPYYAAVSYYNKAHFVWRTTHNVWTLISWTFGWLTGQTQQQPQQRYGVPQPDAGVGFGVRTRGMARREQEILPVDTESTITKYPHSVKSLFYPLLLLLLLFAGYTLYGDRRIRMAHEPVEVEQIHGKPDQQLLKKTQPSDELHQTHLANPSTPKTAIVMDQPQVHLRLPKPALPKAADEAVHQLENTTHNAFASFVEGISLAGQSLLELIVDTFVGTYELLKRIFFVIGIVSMPIKFAKTLAHFARTVVLSIWASLRWMVERLAELPYTLTSSLKQAVQLGIKNISTGTKAFGHDVSIKVTEWKAWLSNAIYEHFVSIWRALRWVVFQFGHTVFVAFDVIGYAAQKTLDGCIYAKNTTVAAVDWLIAKVGSSIFYARDNVVHSFWSIVGKIVRAFIFVRDTAANFFLTTFGKVIDGCISAKHTIVSSLDWLMAKVSSTIFFVRDNVVHFFRSTFEKIFTVISVLFGSIAHSFSSIYNAMASFLQNIWNYMQPSKIATKVEDTLKEAKEEVVPLYDDHPLVQHFNRILTVTLAEEHRSIEKRLREWAELQATTPSPSPDDGKELEDNLRNELDLKMRNEKEELNKTVNKFEEQILQKIRLIIEQMRSQKDTLEQEIDEMRKTQLELKNNAEQRASPLLKKEKITQHEKDGRTETIKESTVLLAHKKQLEQYDERSLLVKVRNLVKEELRRYDADRTGLPDYALESSGGSVLSTRCTVKYDERSRVQKLFGIPLWHLTYSPRSVIQRTGNGVSAGECWAYYGGHGYLTIGLSKRINVTAVSYEHLPVELSPEGHIRSAPRNFFVWSYQDIDDLGTRFLLGNFTYDAEGGDPLQMFPIQHWDPRGTQIVELETLSNWGAHVTCLYRFRVHGESGKKIPEVSADGLSSFDPKQKSSSVGTHKGHGG